MSAHNLPAVLHAINVYDERNYAGRETLTNEARSLAEWGLFSNAHISAITGLRIGIVNGITGKTDHTGGRFHPDALENVAEIIRQEIRSERDPVLVAATLEMGVSSHFLARMTGLPQRTLARWGKRVVARV